MGTVSLLNLGFFEKIATIVDIIPKIIYLLYACLASAVDALQALVRKLAGLDVYYQATTGEAVTGTDPLTEFVYGILGFGESAPLYDALNTVFWSFAIFGLIILVVSTMAAIIKSHYREDSQGTSPWKYIYTAGKAIFTFALVPVLVIIGLQLSSFVLRTLDNITAGSGSEQEMVSMFGQDAVRRFRSETVEGTAEYDDEGNRIEGSGTVTYAFYDFFGGGAPSTSTTFSGMLFKASAYSCNRARTDSYSVEQLREDFFGGGILGNDDSDYPSSGTADEQLEYIAEQVDYLFANNIHLATDYSYWQVVSESNDVAPVWSVTDVTRYGNSVISSFSKYDVSFVWIFYNLWTFNFIIGFVGVFVTFGIMISIILGMMSRLIKGAALFLVYPALLGIAPLDDFKAFKSWGVQFMQQLMMAFGSILGINLLLLVLPYVQNINFFNIGVVDAMIQLIMLVAGLLMAKDFIGMINGFVGGADAMNAGEGAKGSIGGKLKAGLKPAGAIAGAGLRVAGKGALAVGKGAVHIGQNIANKVGRKHAPKAALKANRKKNEALEKMKANGRDVAYMRTYSADKHRTELDNYQEERKKHYIKKGYDEETAENKAKADRAKQRDRFADKDFGGKFAAALNEAEHYKAVAARGNKAETKQVEKYGVKLGKDEKGNDKYFRTAETDKTAKENNSNLGKNLAKDFGEGAADIGKTIADAFLKSVKGVGNVMGVDKAVAGAKEVLGESLTFKGGVFEERKNKRKEAADKDKVEKRETAAAEESSAQTKALEKIAGSMESLLKETKDSAAASRATTKAVQKLSSSLRTSGGSSGGGTSGSTSGDSSGSTSGGRGDTSGS